MPVSRHEAPVVFMCRTIPLQNIWREDKGRFPRDRLKVKSKSEDALQHEKCGADIMRACRSVCASEARARQGRVCVKGACASRALVRQGRVCVNGACASTARVRQGRVCVKGACASRAR
eukprot:6197720-Pleurochrysis_carterae.AAC.6